MMHGIVTLLDVEQSARVHNLWQGLEAGCGLKNIKLTPIPHFSWHLAEGYDFPRLEMSLRRLSRWAKPFTLRVSGLGMFTGLRPVIHIPLVRDAGLSRFHYKLWRRVERYAHKPSPYYAPSAWVPHITLAHGDVDPANLPCALSQLAFQQFDWEIVVDNIALVVQEHEEIGELSYKIDFGKG